MKLIKRKQFIVITLVTVIVFAVLLLFYLFKSSQKIVLPENISQVFMNDRQNGWAMINDGTLITTKDEWNTYNQIYKFNSIDTISKPSLSYVDHTLFVVNFLSKTSSIGIYSSKDEGKTWSESYLDYSDADYGASQLFCSFIDSQNGYLLYCGGPAAGLMPKLLYKTADGGKTFLKVEDISSIHGYPTGMSFNKCGDGFISSNYHGNDNAYLYTTKDQGKTWNNLIVPPPKTSSSFYINGYQPYFIGDSGFIVLEYVSKHPTYIVYYSSDSGKTWNPNGTVKIKSPTIEAISNYSFCDKNTFYIIDDTGNMFKKVRNANRWH